MLRIAVFTLLGLTLLCWLPWARCGLTEKHPPAKQTPLLNLEFSPDLTLPDRPNPVSPVFKRKPDMQVEAEELARHKLGLNPYLEMEHLARYYEAVGQAARQGHQTCVSKGGSQSREGVKGAGINWSTQQGLSFYLEGGPQAKLVQQYFQKSARQMDACPPNSTDPACFSVVRDVCE